MISDRHKMVYRTCERCGAPFQAREERVMKGKGRFCSVRCFHITQREDGMKSRGKEHAIFIYDSSRNMSCAMWRDVDGKQHCMSYARWLWEMNHGEIPTRYRCRWKDGNPQNAVIENIELISLEQLGKEISKRLTGRTICTETKIKMSLAHTGKSKWDGFTRGSHYVGFSRWLKKKIKERDGFICQICGYDLMKSKRSRIHHIDGNKSNSSEDNLILVCIKCHSSIHSRIFVNDKILAFRSMLK